MKYTTSALVLGLVNAQSKFISVENSSVMRAIADANEASAKEKVSEQMKIGKKMEKLENQAKVNEAINKST